MSDVEEVKPEDPDQLTEEQFRRLVIELPFHFFLIVAQADGKVDPAEFMAFSELLESKKICHSPYLRKVIGETAENLQGLRMKHQKQQLEDAEVVIQKVFKSLNHRLEPEHVKRFAEDLLGIGTLIAESSGGGMFKGAVSEEELEALKRLTQLVRQSLQEQ